jgi:hypothetical protein
MPVFKVGSEVQVKATVFDRPGDKWSLREFKDKWNTTWVDGKITEIVGKNRFRCYWPYDKTYSDHTRAQLRLRGTSKPNVIANDSASDDGNKCSSESSRSDEEAQSDVEPMESDTDDQVPTAGMNSTTVSPNPAQPAQNQDPEWKTVAGDWNIDPRGSIPRHPCKLIAVPDISDGGEADIFSHFFPLSMSVMATYCNLSAKSNGGPPGTRWVDVSEAEMWMFMGLFIARSLTPQDSLRSLWPTDTGDVRSLLPRPSFSTWMTRTRFETILRYLAVVDHSKHITASAASEDKWWPVRDFIAAFNANRKSTVYAGWLIVIDELMSSWRGTSMPHLSFIPRKPEPLGCEMKCVADADTGIMLFLEIQESKEAMKSKRHFSTLGATAACTLRAVEDAELTGIGRVLIGDSWFASVKTAVALRNVGTFFVGNVKTATKNFPQKALKDDMNGEVRGTWVTKTSEIKVSVFFLTLFKIT